MQAAGQVDTGSDVTPLVGAADFQNRAVAFVQFGEVVALQQGVGELGEGNAHIVAPDALFDGFLVQHSVDGEMLADVAQEVEAVHFAEPVGVVRHNGGVFAFKAQKRFQLVADAFYPAGNGFGGIQAALHRFEAGVANHTGRAAHQSNRRMPRLLETSQSQYRQQVADMQAVGGRVEAAIEGDFLFV